jgi:hypothetical protein
MSNGAIASRSAAAIGVSCDQAHGDALAAGFVLHARQRVVIGGAVVMHDDLGKARVFAPASAAISSETSWR